MIDTAVVTFLVTIWTMIGDYAQSLYILYAHHAFTQPDFQQAGKLQNVLILSVSGCWMPKRAYRRVVGTMLAFLLASQRVVAV